MAAVLKEFKKWGGFKVLFNCDYCGKENETRKSHFERKSKHYCNRTCYSLDVKENWRPEETNRFKHGLSPLVVSSNWRKRNREKTRHYKMMYYSRKKGAAGSHTMQEWEEVKMKYGYKCAICMKEEKLTKDHIKPLSKGGSNFIDNIQPLCRSCNSRKNNIYENPELIK